MEENNKQWVDEEILDYTIGKLSKVMSTGGSLDFPLKIEQGGTNAEDAETAWDNLGGGTVGKIDLNNSENTYLQGDGQWTTPPDIKVEQNHSTNIAEYPILLKNGTGADNITSTSLFNKNVTVNPSTGTVSATTFKGALNGNATSATKSNYLSSTSLSNVDLDDYRTNYGFYYGAGSNNCTHKPDGVDSFGMIVFQSAGGYTTQLLVSGNLLTNRVYVRTYTNSWTAWESLYSTANPQVNITGNAATASKLGTVNVGTVAQPIYLEGGVPKTVKTPTQGAQWNAIVQVRTDGVSEIGKYIDFHNTDASTNDYDVRLQINSANKTTITLPDATGTVALTTSSITGNAATATTLQNSRNLAVALGTANANGAAFNGGANQLAIPVSGTLGIGNGGTGSTSRTGAFDNLTFLGTNVTNGVANDTREKWKSLGTGYSYVNLTGQLVEQPSQWGYVISVVRGDEIHQEFWQQANGSHWRRGCNSSATTMPGWTLILDTANIANYAPTKTGGGASGSWGISVTGSSASCTGNAATASKLGTATVGGASFPVYLNGGTATKCTSMGTVFVGTTQPTDSNYSIWIDTSS